MELDKRTEFSKAELSLQYYMDGEDDMGFGFDVEDSCVDYGEGDIERRAEFLI